MSAAHTPGPWHTLEVGEFQTKLAVCDADNVSLLTVVDEEGVKFGAVYKEADADLIAAAPDMLAALQRAEIALRFAAEMMPSQAMWDDHKLVVDAINKATKGTT